MTRFDLRSLITDVMTETLPKVNKRDRENFLDLLLEELDDQVKFDNEEPEYNGTNPDSLFDSYND